MNISAKTIRRPLNGAGNLINTIAVSYTHLDVYKRQAYWSAERKYTVPGRCVRAGRNCIAVVADNHCGAGAVGIPALEFSASGLTFKVRPECRLDAVFTLPVSYTHLDVYKRQDWTRRYRTLPRVRFTDVAEYGGAILRRAEAEGSDWYYLVNPTPQPVALRLRATGPELRSPVDNAPLPRCV